MTDPVEYHHEFFLFLFVQLDAVGVVGPDNVVRVGQVVVEAYTGRGRLRRAEARAIRHEWSHVQEAVEARIVGLNRDDASDQLYLANCCQFFTTVDQFAKVMIGWAPLFNSSGTAHGGIPIDVKLPHGQNEDKLLVLWDRAGNRAAGEFRDKSRNGDDAVAIGVRRSVNECIFVRTSIPLT